MGNFTRKQMCWSLILIKLQAWRPVSLLEKTPTQVFCCEIFENFKNTYFEEHLRTTAPECLRKINPLLVLRKPLLDGKRYNWAANTFYWKYEPHEVSSCNIHVTSKCFFDISLRSQKRAKVIMPTIVKYLKPPIVAKKIYIVLNKLREIFKIRIFSHLFFTYI